MAQTNVKKASPKTHEGGKGKKITPYQKLRRSVLTCMLWEGTFYENGESVVNRIRKLTQNKKISPEEISQLAVEARSDMNLRHVPLLLCVCLSERNDKKVGLLRDTVTAVIQRADEITELLSIYWSDEFGGKRPICNQIKSGIKRAFHKFDEYQFAKYNRKQKAIWLRDVMNLTHPKPNSKNEDIFKRLINDELKTPDTWEVNLSAGKNKKETFKRMIKEKKLPYMALLRNLRNMMEAKVDEKLIKEALIDGAERSRALPFRFIAAAKCGSKHLESTIDKAMLMSLKNREKIDGSTIILVDVSGSMVAPLSRNSYMYRLDAAFGLAILSREVFSDCKVYSFSWELADVPDRRGIALADAISKSQSNMGTNLGSALNKLKKKHPNYKRYIVITDEQSHDRVSSPNCERGYLINVAPYQVGVGYDNNWIHIDGFSEATIDFIVEYEKEFMDS